MILIDCRWLGRGGAGRVTEVLLRGLSGLPRGEDFILWGAPELVEPLCDAKVVPTRSDPRRPWSHLLRDRLPPHRVALFPHQIRPLTTRSSATFIYDTIPLHTKSSSRLAKWVYLNLVAARSATILCLSQYARTTISTDVPAARGKIRVVRYPFDPQLSKRVLGLRHQTIHVPRIIFVGRFAAHKNLSRLIEAFRITRFRREGGTLLLAGGSEPEIATMRTVLGNDPTIELRGTISDGELERAYAASSALALISLEEGFGLPAWEAITSELPVALSSGGSLSELAPDAQHCSPYSIESIAETLDAAVVERDTDAPRRRRELVQASAPTIEQFAAAVLDALPA